MTNSICNKSASHWTCVLCCVVGLLLTGIAAANTRLLRFGYGEQEREDLCLQSDMFFDESRSPMPLTIQGHLYYRKGGCVPETVPLARKGQPLPLPLQGQKILVTYKIQTKPGGTQHGHADDSEHTQKTRTDQLGSFQVTTTPVPTDALSVEVTVKYYGQESEQRAPVAEETRVLRPKKFSANPQLTSADDQPTDTQGPKGQYQVRAWLPDDKGTQSFDDRMKKLHLEATHEAQWFNDETLQKLLKAVEINLLKTEQENNAAVYTVQGTDNRAGVVAIKAVYQASDDNQTASEPFMLAFGCKAELGWKNNAPQATDGFACPHADQDEVILQRPSVSGGKAGYSRRYFQKEHALVTLKLKSLLDNQSPLEKIPVKWQLADNQPPNMAVFLDTNTDDEGESWDATGQKLYSSTDENGQREVPVSARQLHKMVNTGKGDNWRPYTPAVGEADVVADIQGQLEHITVPFIDSLWQLAQVSKDDKWVPQLDVLGYVGIGGEKKAARKLVTGQMTDPWSTEGRHLRLSAHDLGKTGSIFRFLLPQKSEERALLPTLRFPCEGCCRKKFEESFGRMCIEQVRPAGDKIGNKWVDFGFDGLSEDAQESRKNITFKFVPDKSSEQCDSCPPPLPDQPATEGKVEDGAFCFNKPLKVPAPTLKLLNKGPDTEGPRGSYQVKVSLAKQQRTNSGAGSELDKISMEVAQDAPWPDHDPPRKDPKAVEISRVSEDTVHNVTSFKMKGLDETAGVIAVNAVYRPDSGIEIKSEPLMLAFGCQAELRWKNNAPNQTADGIDCPHNDDQEIILQRHADGVISNTPLFMGEHAQVTLKLTSLCDNLPLAGINFTWLLEPTIQPDNMAIFTKNLTDDYSSNWSADAQKTSACTDASGQHQIDISARQLYRPVSSSRRDKQDKAYTPAAGNAVVLADIQGQQQRINVPFIDSLWFKGEAGQFFSHDAHIKVLGYVGTDRNSTASRAFVEGALSENQRNLRFWMKLPQRENMPEYIHFVGKTSNPFKFTGDTERPVDFGNVMDAYETYQGPVCLFQQEPTGFDSGKELTLKFDKQGCNACPCPPVTAPQPGSDQGTAVEQGACGFTIP